MRPGEKNELDYYFINDAEFMAMVHENAFIEYAKVFDYLYGTSKIQIAKRLESGIDVVLDIDWQGARQIKSLFNDAKKYFYHPAFIGSFKEKVARQASR